MTERQPTTSVVFDAHEELLSGISTIAEAVGCTLGPQGKTVLIQDGKGSPIITKDGVTVSRSIKLAQTLPGLGSQLIQEAASRTNDVAGDGTTTATILAHALIQGGHRRLKAGYPSIHLCEGLRRARDVVLTELKNTAKEISTGDLCRVGTISANNDAEIGTLIAQAMSKVGRDGIVTVEDAKGTQTTMEVVEGMQFNRGYLSPYFVTDNDRMHALFENARVIVVEGKLDSVQQMVPVLEMAMQSRQGLLVIAGDIEGDVLQTMVLNRVKGHLPVVAVKAPGFGDHRGELLRDICILTGASLVSSQTGLKLSDVKDTHLGRCKRIIVNAKTTALIGTGKTEESVKSHIDELRTQTTDKTIDVDTLVKLQNRIARLAGGVAIIKVGGATELELGERKYRIEDALNATRAAAEEGIVPGGGMALLRMCPVLQDMIVNLRGEHEGMIEGVKVLYEACRAPISRIVSNAGKVPEVIINEAITRAGTNGYDARKGEFVDMLESGIIDPVKVTRTALENAVSVAMTFLSLSAVVYEDAE